MPPEKPTRTRRSGDLGKNLFLDYCMLCKGNTPILVKREKQFLNKILTDTAERAIREVVEQHMAESSLAATSSIS